MTGQIATMISTLMELLILDHEWVCEVLALHTNSQRCLGTRRAFHHVARAPWCPHAPYLRQTRQTCAAALSPDELKSRDLTEI